MDGDNNDKSPMRSPMGGNAGNYLDMSPMAVENLQKQISFANKQDDEDFAKMKTSNSAYQPSSGIKTFQEDASQNLLKLPTGNQGEGGGMKRMLTNAEIKDELTKL